MTHVSLEEAQQRFEYFVELVERGETITVTIDGKPAFDMMPYREDSGLKPEALQD